MSNTTSTQVFLDAERADNRKLRARVVELEERLLEMVRAYNEPEARDRARTALGPPPEQER